jgi:hypothetical protein
MVVTGKTVNINVCQEIPVDISIVKEIPITLQLGYGFPQQTEVDPLSLHLDQTTPQTIENGTPTCNRGITLLDTDFSETIVNTPTNNGSGYTNNYDYHNVAIRVRVFAYKTAPDSTVVYSSAFSYIANPDTEDFTVLTVTAKWNAVAGAEGYVVYYEPWSDGWQPYYKIVSSATTQIDFVVDTSGFNLPPTSPTGFTYGTTTTTPTTPYIISSVPQTAGTIYFNGTHFLGYNGSTWKQLDN